MVAAATMEACRPAHRRLRGGPGLPPPSVGGGGSFDVQRSSNEARNQGRSGRDLVVGSDGQFPQKNQNVSPDPLEGVIGEVGRHRPGKFG
jgi:hypothetical protein